MSNPESSHNECCFEPDSPGDSLAVCVRGLSRRFHIVQRQPSRLIPLGMLNRLFLSFSREPFWALSDIDMTLERGKMFGIFGDNGSGKSTLLKIIAGIVTPTQGDVVVNGRVAPLLELGTGFHMDLTGMENIFLNATILGMRHEQTMERVGRIIEFADIGEHLYSPVRFYSSGMKARLGFAVAVHLDCDIFLIDEILGVGDMQFRAKSFNMIRQLRAEGKTIVLVSHNVEPLKRFCDEVIWIDQGRIVDRGDPETIADSYMAHCLKHSGQRPSPAQQIGSNPNAVETKMPQGSLITKWRLGEARFGEYDLTHERAVVAAEDLEQTRVVIRGRVQIEQALPDARLGVFVVMNGRQLIGELCDGAGAFDLDGVVGGHDLEVVIEPAPFLNHGFEIYGVVYDAQNPETIYDITPMPISFKAPDKGKTFEAFTWDAPARWELSPLE